MRAVSVSVFICLSACVCVCVGARFDFDKINGSHLHLFAAGGHPGCRGTPSTETLRY